MDRYLSHLSAAAYYNIPHIDIILGDKLDNLDLVDYTVTSPSKRNKVEGQRIHLCTTPMPEDAVRLLDSGEYVASAELVFLNLAYDLDFRELVFLGNQLCSREKPWSEESITTKSKLKKVITGAVKSRGRRKALRALKYIEDGSCSVMETLVFMVLTLPNRHGGFGLREAKFNHEIILDFKSRKTLNMYDYNCFVDLFYEIKNLALEYDSDAHHSTPEELAKDAKRCSVIENLGYTVMSMSTQQLQDTFDCLAFVKALAKKLGKRIRIRTKKFEDNYNKIRSFLPSYY